MSDPPRLRVRGPLRRALTADALAQIPKDALARFLLERRWFGGKGKAPATVHFRDVIPLFDGAAAITRLDVDEGTDRASTYQLPIVARPESPGALESPLGVLATIECDEGRGHLLDALGDAEIRSLLGDALCEGATFANDGAQWRIEPIAAHQESRGPSRVLRAEQSNTSVAFRDRSMLKLYRRIAPGRNPDVEVGDFLARQGRFPNVPRLLAIIRFVDGAKSETIAGMLQEFVPSRGDAWAFALDCARAEAVDRQPANDELFAGAARRLGEVTRGLHEALAAPSNSPEFAPEPATAADAAAWGEAVARQVKHAGEALAAQVTEPGFPAEARPLARTCLEHLADALRRARSIAASFEAGAGQKIRHHGDYHLGQVLVTEHGGFMILDFEGEPARPLAERRQRHCALRDVAGMVRSISYAAAAAARAAGRPDASERLARWEREARAAFLNGYFGSELPSFLPQTTEAASDLLELFEIEKAFYELAYEVNHRPDWVEIPLRAVARAFETAR